MAAVEPLELVAVGALLEVELDEPVDVEVEPEVELEVVDVVAVPLAWEAAVLCAANPTAVAPIAAVAARPAVTTVTWRRPRSLMFT